MVRSEGLIYNPNGFPLLAEKARPSRSQGPAKRTG